MGRIKTKFGPELRTWDGQQQRLEEDGESSSEDESSDEEEDEDEESSEDEEDGE